MDPKERRESVTVWLKGLPGLMDGGQKAASVQACVTGDSKEDNGCTG